MWDLLTDEERAWKRTCRRFATEVIEPRYRRYDQENAFPREVHERAYQAGLMNVGFAETLGGRGMSHRALVVGGEELAAVCSPTAFTMGFNHGALQPVLHAGTDEQRGRFVRDLLASQGYASICLTEAAVSGSNLMGLNTRAVRTGRGWSLSGTKVMVGNGCEASLFVVLADAVVDGKRRGPTFFVVPRGAGVRVGPNTDKIGFRCVTTPTVVFEEVELTDEHRLGEVGEAERVLLATLDYIRFGGAAVILGIVVGALRDVVPWVGDRRVYGDEPLVAKSHVQLELAEIYTGVRSVRHLLWRAAELLDRRAPCSVETSMAKLSASRLAVDATNRIVQLYGWRGIDREYAIEKRMRDARVTTIYEGTSEIQLLNIFRELTRSIADGGDL
jgi:alkylation response protein AidB-like acyl-CoA dehydrogenase